MSHRSEGIAAFWFATCDELFETYLTKIIKRIVAIRDQRNLCNSSLFLSLPRLAGL